MSDVLANFEAIEGNGDGTFTLRLKSRKLIITNDSSSVNLKWKLNSSEDFGTLFPTESISMYVTTKTVFLQGTGDYRIWSFG